MSEQKPRGSRAHQGLRDAKELLAIARCETGVTYQEVADGIGLSRHYVYQVFNRTEDMYHIRYGDLLRLSESGVTAVKLFLHAILEPLEKNMTR